MPIRVLDAEASGPIVRRINHGERNVDGTDETLPELADPDVTGSGGGRPEHINRHLYVKRFEFRLCILQESSHRVDAKSIFRPRVGRAIEILSRGVGKTHVVPLDLRETGRCGLLSQPDVVVPHPLVVKIGPNQTLAVHPDATRRILHRPIRARANQERILYDHDAGDRIKARFLDPLQQPHQVPNADLLIRARLPCRHHLGRITHVAGGVLEVDDEGVDFGSRS